MNLDLVNDLFSNIKENKIVQNFMKELSNYLENNETNNSKIEDTDYKWNDLFSNDLTLYDNKIISKFKGKMLIERTNILQNYAENTKEKGEMYYIYNTSENKIKSYCASNKILWSSPTDFACDDGSVSYNLCICKESKSHEVITKQIGELPEGAKLGSVLREQEGNFTLDINATKIVGKEINTMIKEKIEEQNQYLKNARVEGHIYEVGEKGSGRIWLYDLNNVTNGGMEGIEEIKFPKELYQDAKEGDLFMYKNGEYQKYMKH